jgi:hypothetical protein
MEERRDSVALDMDIAPWGGQVWGLADHSRYWSFGSFELLELGCRRGGVNEGGRVGVMGQERGVLACL